MVHLDDLGAGQYNPQYEMAIVHLDDLEAGHLHAWQG